MSSRTDRRKDGQAQPYIHLVSRDMIIKPFKTSFSYILDVYLLFYSEIEESNTSPVIGIVVGSVFGVLGLAGILAIGSWYLIKGIKPDTHYQ